MVFSGWATSIEEFETLLPETQPWTKQESAASCFFEKSLSTERDRESMIR
jgi:hypothetical protein